MKNKYLILIISCIVLIVIILLIMHTCGFFSPPTAPAIPQEESKQTPETVEQAGTEPNKEILKARDPVKDDIGPANTQKDDTKAVTPATQENKLPPFEDVFEFLTEYGGHTYYISRNEITWMEAASICPQYGGHLVTITSKAENKALITAIQSKINYKNIWIGLSDYKKEGRWTWITGEELSFTFWDTNQPDNWAMGESRREDFALIWQNPAPKLAYHWNDASDTTTALFILEIEP
ncbi:MAG: C-type lectin domain-containing protein [Spirochaetales bacterium]|nr:C-type lectin domain-containing protein [Spirochaetales bacterium]